MTRTIPNFHLSFVFLVLLTVAGVAWAQDDAAEAAAEETAAGFAMDREPERCISIQRIRDTRVIDDSTILFNMGGGVTYVNHLRYACHGLAREKRFSYRVTTGRLCSVDTIRVLEQYGGTLRQGIGCGLGEFYPITTEEAELLRAESRPRRGGPQIEVENPNDDEAEGEPADADADGEGAGEAAE